MALRRKSADPIDRAIDDLDRQIATLQRELREAGTPSARPGLPERSGGSGRNFAQFVRNILAPPRRTVEVGSHARDDLFDVAAEPLKDLEAEPISFASKPDPDLFTRGPGASPSPATALETAQVVPAREKLAHYLGAGSIKSYKPLKHVQRKTRNRFFMWMGLSFVALWIIWFVIR